MKKLAKTSMFYMILGLVLGVYYREFTKIMGFASWTQLKVTHTHTLILGMFFFLIVLLLEKNFKVSEQKHYKKFYIIYNVGLLLSISMMVLHGTLTVLGYADSAAITGIAGLGHIIITVGLGFFFHSLMKSIDTLH